MINGEKWGEFGERLIQFLEMNFFSLIQNSTSFGQRMDVTGFSENLYDTEIWCEMNISQRQMLIMGKGFGEIQVQFPNLNLFPGVKLVLRCERMLYDSFICVDERMAVVPFPEHL